VNRDELPARIVHKTGYAVLPGTVATEVVPSCPPGFRRTICHLHADDVAAAGADAEVSVLVRKDGLTIARMGYGFHNKGAAGDTPMAMYDLQKDFDLMPGESVECTSSDAGVGSARYYDTPFDEVKL